MRLSKATYGLITIASLGALVLSGCAATGPDSGPESATEGGWDDIEPITLTYSDSNVDTAAHAIAMQDFMETVTERTEGKVTFETYWSASLHPAAESLSAVESGLTDITFVTTTALPDQLPVTSWQATAAQGFVPSEFPTSLIAGSPVQVAEYETGAVAEELARYDAAPLMSWNTVPYPLLCKPEVQTAADLAGLAIRTAGVNWTMELESLGMTTISMPLQDTYEAAQRGILHCHMATTSVIITLGLWDDSKHFVPNVLATAAGSVVLIKKSVLDSLPQQVQDVIFEARVDLIANTVERTLARDLEFAERSAEQGITWVDPSTFRDAVSTERDRYVQAAIADGPDSLDAQGAYDYMTELYGLWKETTSSFDYQAGSPERGEDWIDLYRSVQDIDWDAYRTALRDYFDEAGVR